MAITRGLLTRADVAHFDGQTATATRKDATGGDITGLAFGNEVDVLQVFGAGTARTVGTMLAAVAAQGTSTVTFTFAPGTWTVDDNITIPSTIVCYIPAGCVFAVSAGKTLTFQGHVNVDYAKTWFSGSGSVVREQTLTGAGAVDLLTDITWIVTTSTDALTLADGAEGQRKLIIMKTDGGDGTLTPSNYANGTTIIFTAVGDSVELIFTNGSWHLLTPINRKTVTFDNLDATPSIAESDTFLVSGTTAITDFDDGEVGDVIHISNTQASNEVVITDNGNISLKGSIDYPMGQADTLTLAMIIDTVWYEIGRKIDDGPEIVTSFTNTLQVSESGKTIFLTLAGGGSTVLPAPGIGLNFKFIVAVAPTTAYTIDAKLGNNIMHGTHLDIVGELVYGSSQDIISFVANTSLVGDRCMVVSDGTSWFYEAYSGADGGITTGVT